MCEYVLQTIWLLVWLILGLIFSILQIIFIFVLNKLLYVDSLNIPVTTLFILID